MPNFEARAKVLGSEKTNVYTIGAVHIVHHWASNWEPSWKVVDDGILWATFLENFGPFFLGSGVAGIFSELKLSPVIAQLEVCNSG